MSDDLRISLVVPTLHRDRYLDGALRSFLLQDLAPTQFEIIVVDNGCADETCALVRRTLHEASCPWRYVREERPGLHHARNRGILEARGDLVVFGDDDIVADRFWLSSILVEFDLDSRVGVVGGTVLPIWEQPPSPWVCDFGNERFHRVFAYLDRGRQRERLESEHVIGCNLAIRRQLAIQIGGSLPDTFPDHLRALSGTGETGMIDNARSAGYAVVYSPRALVHHHVPAARMTLRYFIARNRRSAVEEAFDEFRAHGRVVGSLRTVARAITGLARLALELPTRNDPLRFSIVRLATSLEAFVHVGRLLTRPSLYRHTRCPDYLAQRRLEVSASAGALTDQGSP